jgi:hypothetical protein
MKKIIIPLSAAGALLYLARLYYSQMFDGLWFDAGFDRWGMVGYWLVLTLPFVVAAPFLYLSLWFFNFNMPTRIATSAAVAVVIAAFGLAGEVVLCIVLFRPGCL